MLAQVEPANGAPRQNPIDGIGLVALAHEGPVLDQLGEGLRRHPAARVRPALPHRASLFEIGRIDADQAYAARIDLDGVGIHHPGRTRNLFRRRRRRDQREKRAEKAGTGSPRTQGSAEMFVEEVERAGVRRLCRRFVPMLAARARFKT